MRRPQCGRHARVAGIGGWNRGRARQRQAQRLGKRRHRRGGAHGHAGAVAAGDAGLHRLPFVFGDDPGLLVGPVLPYVAARAENLAGPVAAQHRPGRHEDRRQVHRQRAHDRRRRGLVATAHQHDAVDRMRAQQLLHFQRQEVAIEHRRRLDEVLRQRQRRQFDREAARLPDAALHLLGAGAEMRVAGIDVGPGIDDRDHRLAHEVGVVVAHLQRARAMAEGAQVLGLIPAGTAQRTLLFVGQAGFLAFRRRSTGARC